MLTNIQYRILKIISPGAPAACSGCAYEGKSKLGVLMGADLFTKIAGKVIIDFGCGEGADTVEIAGKGAKRVTGIDIRAASHENLQQPLCAAVWSNEHDLKEWPEGCLSIGG